MSTPITAANHNGPGLGRLVSAAATAALMGPGPAQAAPTVILTGPDGARLAVGDVPRAAPCWSSATDAACPCTCAPCPGPSAPGSGRRPPPSRPARPCAP